MTNEEYMSLALDLAREAAEHGEVPVGCVIADAAGRVIGRGRNRREELGDATAHAEVEAIREAGAALGSWRLEGCTMYVTLEPCPMCAGAIVNARIPCVYYGARDEAMGACGGVLNLFMERFPCLVFGARDAVTGSCGSVIDLFFENYGHHPKVYAGVLGDESAELLRSFFKGLR